eukprot:2637885-Amphidinium_carterae.1
MKVSVTFLLKTRLYVLSQTSHPNQAAEQKYEKPNLFGPSKLLEGEQRDEFNYNSLPDLSKRSTIQ